MHLEGVGALGCSEARYRTLRIIRDKERENLESEQIPKLAYNRPVLKRLDDASLVLGNQPSRNCGDRITETSFHENADVSLASPCNYARGILYLPTSRR